MIFFTNTAENTKKEQYFYIPIVERIKDNDFEKSQTWGFARHEGMRRKFYTSPESLYQAESTRFPTVSCYKVSLNDTKKQQLVEQGNYSSGFLHFKATEILSLIVFRAGYPFEQANPFETDTNTLLTSMTGP